MIVDDGVGRDGAREVVFAMVLDFQLSETVLLGVILCLEKVLSLVIVTPIVFVRVTGALTVVEVEMVCESYVKEMKRGFV